MSVDTGGGPLVDLRVDGDISDCVPMVFVLCLVDHFRAANVIDVCRSVL